MARSTPIPAALAALLAAASLAPLASPARAADETSSGDKLRMLYANQWSFTDDGLPVVTIELASGLDTIRIDSAAGITVRPDGDSGAAIRAGREWTLSVKNTRPAVLREWTVVARHHPDATRDIEATVSAWKQRGFSPRTFEIGTLFGISGDVLDSRESLIAVSPVGAGKGRARAQALSRKFGVDTSVHRELVRMPRGTVVAQSGDVVIENPSVIWFYPGKDEGTIRVHDLEVGGGGSQLTTRRETRRYFGAMYATIGRDGKLVVVNAVSVDRLLAGIVPSEIFASAPRAALEAQAVAARTELLDKLGRRYFGDPFLLCSTQQCQVYSGAGKEHPRTTAAVKATRGIVLMGQDKQLVDARFSAACGGHSEAAHHVWGIEKDPHLVGRSDAIPGTASARRFASGITAENLAAYLDAPASEFYEGSTRFAKGRFRWTRTLDAAELSRRIARAHRDLGRITDLIPGERGVSGRAAKLRIVGTDETITVTGDLRIRRLLNGLRSTAFVVEKVGDPRAPTAFRLRGAGFGHGVGMCQVGAIGMAEHKKTYQQILHHYFRGASLKRLY